MWVFTEWANGFDKVKDDNAKALDSWLQEWVATTLDDSSPWYRNALIYTAAGAAYAVNKLSTEVASSFVDVLRIGDGVQEGGWGYGKDALRLLIIAGPAIRSARYGITLVAAVDETASVGNCSWISATRALRMTGTKHYARVGDLAKASGITIGETGGAYVDDLLLPMNNLGAEVKQLGTLNSMEAVFNAARANPNGVVMFSIEWRQGGTGARLGHTLLATRGPGGVIRIIDRSGKVVSNLSELESLYRGIGQATVYGTAGVVQNAKIVTLLNNAPLLMNLLAVELRSVPVPPPLLGVKDSPIILKTDTQLLTGWWVVKVSKWTWIYYFDANGSVSWTDPYNLKTGKGTWKAKNNGISISWVPPSKTTEQWDLPISGNSQTGKYSMKEGTFPLKAYKVDVQQLIGRWKVEVSKWTWHYDFTANGSVRWTDPYNNETGKGTWKLASGRVLVSWAPASKTTEDWNLPFDESNQTGKCRMQAGTFPLKAMKM